MNIMLKQLRRLCGFFFLGIMLSACAQTDTGNSLLTLDSKEIDPRGDLTRDDFRNLTPKQQSEKPIAHSAENAMPVEEPPIPDVTDILIAPRPPKLAEEQTVSLSVTDDIPLRDVLIELSRLADVDLEMSPNISGGIIYRARNRPFSQVVDRVCELGKLRCTIENRILKVEQDTPYLKTYPLDFLNQVRSSEGNVTISTNVLSAGGGENSSLNTGSSSSINALAESDFWSQLESTLGQILNVKSGGAPSSGGESPAAASAAGNTQSSENASDNEDSTYFVINRQGGVLTVSGTQKQQQRITEFLKRLRASATAQVLIEAKIVEVTLNEDFQSGIDWGSIGFGGNLDFDFSLSTSSDTGSVGVLSLTNGNKNGALEAAISLTEEFGTARTLSSPRLHAMNNQQAVLTFAENEVYFDLSIERERDTDSVNPQELLTVDSEVKTVPIGIIVVMQPSINTETNEITLNVRPTLSRVVNRVADPAVGFLLSDSPGLDIQNEVPVVEVRELDSIMKMKSGNVMIIGGLMEQRQINTDRGIPVLSEVPMVGNLFKSTDKQNEVVEMVIFIKATIVNDDNVSDQDVNFYRRFTNDPRPLTF